MPAIEDKKRTSLVKELLGTQLEYNKKVEELSEYVDFIFDVSDEENTDSQTCIDKGNNELLVIANRIEELQHQIDLYDQYSEEQMETLDTILDEMDSNRDKLAEAISTIGVERLIELIKIKVRNKDLNMQSAFKMKRIIEDVKRIERDSEVNKVR